MARAGRLEGWLDLYSKSIRRGDFSEKYRRKRDETRGEKGDEKTLGEYARLPNREHRPQQQQTDSPKSISIRVQIVACPRNGVDSLARFVVDSGRRVRYTSL